MKQALVAAVITAMVTSAAMVVADGYEETSAEFFRKDHERMAAAQGKINAEAECLIFCQSAWTLNEAPQAQNKVSRLIVVETERKLGKKWVSTMLQIAKVESGYRCNAVGPRLGKSHHGERAMGVFQVLPSSAKQLGFKGSKEELLSCDGGIQVGLAHAKRCLDWGVSSMAEMASCHVSGQNWNVPLKRRSAKYRRQYIAMVTHKRNRMINSEEIAQR
jgi:hypothetical protein